jgi:hypothetical protein
MAKHITSPIASSCDSCQVAFDGDQTSFILLLRIALLTLNSGVWNLRPWGLWGHQVDDSFRQFTQGAKNELTDQPWQPF